MLADKVIEINNTIYSDTKYANTFTLNGFILQQPKFITNDVSGKESCSFIITQIMKDDLGKNMVKTFNIMTYFPEHVKQLKEVDRVCFITCKGTIQWNRKLKTYYPFMISMEISLYLDMELEPPYERTI